MRTHLLLLLSLSLAACGGDDNKTTADAAVDAAERPTLPLTAQSYCDTITAACKDANSQFPAADASVCLGFAAALTPGASSNEMSGNTLGCRIYHAQNAMITGDVATHCPHAGPVGGKSDGASAVCGASPCEDFCATETKLCGTDANPVAGVTNRYTDVAACMSACAAFDKTAVYTGASGGGQTFACRIVHLGNVAKYTAANMPTTVNAHCGHTLANGNAALGPCSQTLTAK